MKHYFQPKQSSTCGQHCVAMIAGIEPEESIKIFGSVGGTRTKQVSEVLSSLGFVSNDFLSRIRKDTVLPDLCILKIVYSKTRSHWVVYEDGFIYCPGLGIYLYSIHDESTMGRITSYLKISKDESII